MGSALNPSTDFANMYRLGFYMRRYRLRTNSEYITAASVYWSVHWYHWTWPSRASVCDRTVLRWTNWDKCPTCLQTSLQNGKSRVKGNIHFSPVGSCVCGVYVCVCVCVVYTVVQFSFFIKPSFRCFFLASNTKPPTFVLPKTCTNWSETFDFVDPTADTIDLYLPSIYRVMADTESCCCRCIGVEAD